MLVCVTIKRTHSFKWDIILFHHVIISEVRPNFETKSFFKNLKTCNSTDILCLLLAPPPVKTDKNRVRYNAGPPRFNFKLTRKKEVRIPDKEAFVPGDLFPNSLSGTLL
jgi:hypothetical protein